MLRPPAAAIVKAEPVAVVADAAAAASTCVKREAVSVSATSKTADTFDRGPPPPVLKHKVESGARGAKDRSGTLLANHALNAPQVGTMPLREGTPALRAVSGTVGRATTPSSAAATTTKTEAATTPKTAAAATTPKTATAATTTKTAAAATTTKTAARTVATASVAKRVATPVALSLKKTTSVVAASAAIAVTTSTLDAVTSTTDTRWPTPSEGTVRASPVPPVAHTPRKPVAAAATRRTADSKSVTVENTPPPPGSKITTVGKRRIGVDPEGSLLAQKTKKAKATSASAAAPVRTQGDDDDGGDDNVTRILVDAAWSERLRSDFFPTPAPDVPATKRAPAYDASAIKREHDDGAAATPTRTEEEVEEVAESAANDDEDDDMLLHNYNGPQSRGDDPLGWLHLPPLSVKDSPCGCVGCRAGAPAATEARRDAAAPETRLIVARSADTVATRAYIGALEAVETAKATHQRAVEASKAGRPPGLSSSPGRAGGDAAVAVARRELALAKKRLATAAAAKSRAKVAAAAVGAESGWDMEDQLFRRFAVVIGVDEVGTGALAGPLYVCALALERGAARLPGVRDSKRYKGKQAVAQRAAVARGLRAAPGHRFALIECPVEHIDARGRDTALDDALRIAIDCLLRWPPPAGGQAVAGQAPSAVALVVDGNRPLPPTVRSRLPGRAIERADERAYVVAAASVVAKDARDAHMHALAAARAELAPYAFGANAGYGVKAHRDALRMHGPVAGVHRPLFVRKTLAGTRFDPAGPSADTSRSSASERPLGLSSSPLRRAIRPSSPSRTAEWPSSPARPLHTATVAPSHFGSVPPAKRAKAPVAPPATAEPDPWALDLM